MERRPEVMNPDQQVQAAATPEDMKGRYVNFVTSQVSVEEMVLDFAAGIGPEVVILGRFFMSLPHAKRFAKDIAAKIEAYETRFGQIDERKARIVVP